MITCRNDEQCFPGLTFLGRGAAFNPAEGNTSAYIREKDRMLLLDCGESVFERLAATRVLEGLLEINILISHLHSDHCGSLGTLVYYCHFVVGCRVNIVLPKGHEAYTASVQSLLSLFGLSEDWYRCIDVSELQEFETFRSVRYVPTRHDPKMPCFSFELETPNGGVFYSADTCDTGALADFLRTHEQVAAIYMEANDSEAPDSVHMSLNKLRAFLPDAMLPKTRLMHLSSEACIQKAREMGFEVVQTTK